MIDRSFNEHNDEHLAVLKNLDRSHIFEGFFFQEKRDWLLATNSLTWVHTISHTFFLETTHNWIDVHMYIYLLVIQVRNSKIDFIMEALSISCRNKHWSQYFNWILFSSTPTGYLTICLAKGLQAALESRAACTTTAGHIEG